MSDIADRANDQADMLLRHSLQAQRLKGALQAGTVADQAQWRVLSAEYCEGTHCGEPIPDERRRLLPGAFSSSSSAASFARSEIRPNTRRS